MKMKDTDPNTLLSLYIRINGLVGKHYRNSTMTYQFVYNDLPNIIVDTKTLARYYRSKKVNMCI